ncbi:MAG: ABC transporter ATP-binding protein, partial [Devosia sp.]
YGLKIAGKNKTEIAERVGRAANMLELAGFLDRKPRALSGGQRQRVAMGRALVRDPAAFLFDEPLSNLDAKLRVQMRLEIKALQRAVGTTSLYVTHDQVEAMTMADRIVVMDGGAIRQVGTPMDVYRNPNSVFVASFLGAPPTNCIDGEVTVNNGAARFVAPALSVPLPASARPGRGTLGIRPESFSLSQQSSEDIRLEGRVRFVEALGAETLIDVAMEGQGGAAYLTARLPGQHDFAQGRPIGLFAAPASLRLFDADGNHAGMGR